MSTPDKYPPVVSPGWGPTPKNRILLFFKIELGVPNHVRKTRKTHIIICDFLDSECKIILQNLAYRKNIKSGWVPDGAKQIKFQVPKAYKYKYPLVN